MRRSTRTFLLGVSILCSTLTLRSQAQTLPPIQIDRPDQTECAFIVPAGYLQAENGFLREQRLGGVRYLQYPSALWKLGLNERFELRMITELVTLQQPAGRTSGLNPVTLGFKANLLQGQGWVPKTSFIGHLTSSNLGSPSLRTTYAAPSFRFTMQNELSERFSLGYNLGMRWDGETPEPQYLYTLALGMSITDQWGAYAEVFGFAPTQSRASHAVDGGFTYLLNQDVILDLSGSFGLTDNASPWYLALGLSYRFRVFPTQRRP